MRDVTKRVDEDGVVRVERPGPRRVWWVVGALLFAIVCVLASHWIPLGEAPSMEAAREERAQAVAPVERRSVPPPHPVNRPEPEVPVSDNAGGEKSGLALFHPGTKPIKRGLVVPEAFELPPGYMRHYQTMDDGRQLPAILMFHPDFKPTGADGQPVELPEHRVVPPELAPPGLPLAILEVPEPLEEPPPSEMGDSE